jgi:DNA polymerase-3 subunit delta'
VSGWSDIVGQRRAVAQLQAAGRAPLHAYLLVGPRGAGKRAAARVFAADVLAGDSSGDDALRHRRLAEAEQHPDLVMVVPEGRSLRRAEADTIITEGFRSPIEGRRKVIVVDRFHSAEPEAAASLLKTIEEPPGTAVFVLLAEEVPPEHVTIASRCIRIDFPGVAEPAIAEYLVAQGVDPSAATEIASASGGNVDRARLLASDDRFAARRRAWHDVPGQLDGTGAMVIRQVSGLRALIDDALVPLTDRQAAEVAQIAAWEDEYGTRGSGRRNIEERHKREARLLREDELRLGLATLARRYRDRLVDAGEPAPFAAACARITAASESLIRNPNEALLLEALFLDLPPLAGADETQRAVAP